VGNGKKGAGTGEKGQETVRKGRKRQERAGTAEKGRESVRKSGHRREKAGTELDVWWYFEGFGTRTLEMLSTLKSLSLL
jgi:hypothetical protein